MERLAEYAELLRRTALVATLAFVVGLFSRGPDIPTWVPILLTVVAIGLGLIATLSLRWSASSEQPLRHGVDAAH
jgi:hypothetical protein